MINTALLLLKEPVMIMALVTSPRELTDYGAKLSQQIHAPSLAGHYALSLRDKIGSMNAWQIQDSAPQINVACLPVTVSIESFSHPPGRPDMNTVLMLLKDNILNVIIIGFFLSVWASWKIARWSKGVDASLKRTEQCLDRLEETVHRIDARVDALSTRVDTLSTRVDTISQKVDALYHIFMVFLGHRVERTTSPRTLTDYGTKLSLEIDAPSLAAHYAAGLRDKIGSMSAWQIQELCFNHAENEIMNDLQQHDIDRYNQITMCACREGIELSQVMRVVGLVMRDQLLQQAGQLPRAQIALALPGDDPTHAISPPDQTDRESRQPKQ